MPAYMRVALVVPNSATRDCSPSGSSVRGLPGKNTGGWAAFASRIFLTQGLEPPIYYISENWQTGSHAGTMESPLRVYIIQKKMRTLILVPTGWGPLLILYRNSGFGLNSKILVDFCLFTDVSFTFRNFYLIIIGY